MQFIAYHVGLTQGQLLPTRNHQTTVKPLLILHSFPTHAYGIYHSSPTKCLVTSQTNLVVPAGATAGTIRAVPDCSTNHDSADRIMVNSYNSCLSVHRQLHREQCKVANSEMIKAKTKYYHKKMSDTNISQKDIFQVANPLINGKRGRSMPSFEKHGCTFVSICRFLKRPRSIYSGGYHWEVENVFN